MLSIIFSDDLRLIVIKEYLSKNGISLETFCKESTTLILDPRGSIPSYLEDEIMFSKVNKVFTGTKTSFLTRLEAENQVEIVNYLENDDLSIENASLTSEGLLKEVIEKTPFSINKHRFLIIGFGKCGKTIAKNIAALGGYVFIDTIEYTDQISAIIQDFQTKYNAKDIDVIINTVENKLIDTSLYNDEVFIFDISSAPHANILINPANKPKRYYILPGLPGKYSYKTSGYLIAKYLIELI